MSNFHVGQKVVCVNDNWTHPLWRRCHGIIRPVRNGIYTVRTVGDEKFEDGEQVGLRLEEIVNNPIRWIYGYDEIAFVASRFRPVIERKTDISVFTAMLTPKLADEKVQ